MHKGEANEGIKSRNNWKKKGEKIVGTERDTDDDPFVIYLVCQKLKRNDCDCP